MRSTGTLKAFHNDVWGVPLDPLDIRLDMVRDNAQRGRLRDHARSRPESTSHSNHPYDSRRPTVSGLPSVRVNRRAHLMENQLCGCDYRNFMARMRRKDLKPAKPASDAELLRRAQASSTRHQNRLAKQSRAEAADRELRRAEPG